MAERRARDWEARIGRRAATPRPPTSRACRRPADVDGRGGRRPRDRPLAAGRRRDRLPRPPRADAPDGPVGAGRPRRPRRARRPRAVATATRPASAARAPGTRSRSIAAVEHGAGRAVRRRSRRRPPAAAAPRSRRASTPSDGGRLEPVWHMIGSEHAVAAAATTGRRRRDFERGARGWRATSSARRRVRAHAILHDEHGVVPRRRRRSTSRGARRVYERAARDRPAADRRALVHAARRSRATRRDGLRVPRHHLAAARLGALGRAVRRARARTCVERYGIDEVARWGFEVWNEAEPRGLLERARRTSTSGSTTSPRAR